MKIRPFLLLTLLSASVSLFPQALGSFLPAKAASRAARLLDAIDAYSSAIDAARALARRDQLKAETDATQSFALVAASRASRGEWASPEGTLKSSDAGAAFTTAREAARAAALSLATEGPAPSQGGGSSQASARVAGRKAAAESLSALIRESAIKEKAALGLEKALAGRARGLGSLFPEALELEGLMRVTGAPGLRELDAALACREAEAIAQSLLGSKSRLVALSSAAAGPLARLQDSLDAYRSWLAVSAIAAYPGELGSASPEDRVALAASIGLVLQLGQARASSLFTAMSAGSDREAAAAGAARRLAELWDRSSAARRRDLALVFEMSESSLALFAAIASPRQPLHPRGQASLDYLEAMKALNGLEIAIADEEGLGDRSTAPEPRGPEPALLFLERPELAGLARSEPRFAKTWAESSRRLGALYAQAAEGAQARLESSLPVFKAAARALGSSPTDLVVRAIDLSLPKEESGRRLAFFATATDASGTSISLPLRAETAGAEYAAAFARAAGLRQDRVDALALLSKYGQRVVSAYDPEGSGDAFIMDFFPVGLELPRRGSGASARFEDIDLEFNLLGGWRP